MVTNIMRDYLFPERHKSVYGREAEGHLFI